LQRNFGIGIAPGIFLPMSSKTWRNLAVTYLVLCVVAFAIERHGLERGPMSPIEKILAAPILWGLAIYGLQRDSVMGRFSWIDRSEKPVSFWTLIAFEFLYGIFLFCWGIRDALR
jgi:hypothetical protein